MLLSYCMNCGDIQNECQQLSSIPFQVIAFLVLLNLGKYFSTKNAFLK